MAASQIVSLIFWQAPPSNSSSYNSQGHLATCQLCEIMVAEQWLVGARPVLVKYTACDEQLPFPARAQLRPGGLASTQP